MSTEGIKDVNGFQAYSDSLLNPNNKLATYGSSLNGYGIATSQAEQVNLFHNNDYDDDCFTKECAKTAACYTLGCIGLFTAAAIATGLIAGLGVFLGAIASGDV
ncbi:hypothetical protein [Parashewanella tropica]|uniref:hypothetical protein n=1 Tax=Parashewanella tropica TaxID=2547970 RepID=UPI001059D61C|nr:hypothetical protein [Parashewanella tropica]